MFIEDLFILAGLIVILITTYQIDKIIGNYLLGLILLITGVFIAKSGGKPPIN